MGMSALAIDVSQWYQDHHQAQVVADSAALAAANCLANPNSNDTTVNGVSQPPCASSTDTSDAQNLAVAYAGANGLTINDSAVTFNTTAGTVTVTASVNGPAFFGRIYGLITSNQTAQATASWRPSKQAACGTPGSSSTNCDFMFANSNDCNSGGEALNLNLQGDSAVYGNIVTNGSLQASQTGGGSNHYIAGSGSFGSGSSCTTTVNTSGGNKNPWNTTPSQANAPVNWPIDYTRDFPACGASPLSACVNGYPAWCTVTQSGTTTWTVTPTSGDIYCDSGSGTASTPSTWSGGNIAISGSSWNDTFVASSLSYSPSGGTVSACGYSVSGYTTATCSAAAPATANYPIFYATGTDPSGSYALSLTGSGNGTIQGDMFVPNGTVYVSLGGTITLTSFIEANAINASLKGTLNGDGPELNGGDSGATISGGDLLTG